MGMSTTRTLLRGMTGVYADHLAAMLLGLVLDVLAQAGIRPLVHGPALRLAVLFRAVTNFRQIFNDNCRAWLHRLNYLPTDDVIAVGAKPLHFPRQPFEMAFGGRC